MWKYKTECGCELDRGELLKTRRLGGRRLVCREHIRKINCALFLCECGEVEECTRVQRDKKKCKKCLSGVRKVHRIDRKCGRVDTRLMVFKNKNTDCGNYTACLNLVCSGITIDCGKCKSKTEIVHDYVRTTGSSTAVSGHQTKTHSQATLTDMVS